MTSATPRSTALTSLTSTTATTYGSGATTQRSSFQGEIPTDLFLFIFKYVFSLFFRDEQGRTLLVYINVSVLAFPFIETFNLKFTSDFFLQLRWYDLRIDFQVQPTNQPTNNHFFGSNNKPKPTKSLYNKKTSKPQALLAKKQLFNAFSLTEKNMAS